MISEIIKIYRKEREKINYIFFGILTTLVNYLTYFLCYKIFYIQNVPSNIIAWFTSVIFAFVVNKSYVFESKSWDLITTTREIIKFASVRVLTGVFDTFIMYIGVDLLAHNETLVKIFSNIIVLITNYIGSKLFIFNKK